jgi:2-polyprenylphenol 6-hydroxylase
MMQKPTDLTFDIIIIGAGMVGMTLALALLEYSHLRIGLLEAKTAKPTWDSGHYHHRVSAISLASARIFKKLNVWQALVAARVNPYQKMMVWQGLQHKPSLTFDSLDIKQNALGFIIENNLIESVLAKRLESNNRLYFKRGLQLHALHETAQAMEIYAEQDLCFKTQLIIGADGANSWLRENANIDVIRDDYQQHAIVTTVFSQVPHANIARQRFLDDGPLAFLPLSDPVASSIVWTQSSDKAAASMQLNDQAFIASLSPMMQTQLGLITNIEKRYSFPLIKQNAQSYIKNRIALVGDAAHQVHPLAGQGVNIGLLDAASLLDVIIAAERRRSDFSSFANLRRYERWRRTDNAPLLMAIDYLQKIYQTKYYSCKILRNMASQLINSQRFLKTLFIHHAVGDRSDLPWLAQY